MFHCNIRTISRSHGHAATAIAASRSGEVIHDNRMGMTFNYSRRSGIDNTLLIGWEGSRSELWNAAENSEKRKNACVAREVIISLPCEWSASERMDGVRKFGDHLRNTYGVAVDSTIHAPGKQGDQRNWHAHVLMTTRVVRDGVFFEKTRILDSVLTGSEEIRKIRKKLSEILSEGSQNPELWSHESYAERGIEKTPGKHIGAVRTSMKRRGYGDPRCRH